MTRYVHTAAIAAAAILLASPSHAIAGDTKGAISYKGTTVALAHAYLVTGPDAVDPATKIRRVVLSASDIGAKLQACTTMSCADGLVTEGMTVELTGGRRLNYWVALKDGKQQYSGTAELDALRARTDDATKLAGKLTIDDTAAGGPKIDVDFDAAFVKEMTAAR